MDYKLETILSRVTELTDDLEVVSTEVASLQKRAGEIKQEIKNLLQEFYSA